MMQSRKPLLRVFCLLAIITLVCSFPVYAAMDEVEVTGTVFALEWDSDDNVTAVLIATEEGEEITVSNMGKGVELLKLEEKTVKATGRIDTDEEGRKTITVTRYMVQE
jgi:hypothetical protein